MGPALPAVIHLRADGYALGICPTTAESFVPPSTPALEVRTVPSHNFYVKSMVLAAVTLLFHKTQPVSSAVQWHSSGVSEIGLTRVRRHRRAAFAGR